MIISLLLDSIQLNLRYIISQSQFSRATESVQEKQTFEPYRSRLRVKGDAENAS